MAIDHPHSGSRYGREHDVREQAHRLRYKLEDAGVKVVDMRVRVNPRRNYMDYYTIGGDLNKVNLIDDVEYDVEWTLEMSNGQVRDVIELADKCRYFEEKLHEIDKQRMLANTDLRSLRERIRKLERTLDDNPGIREQWDEMMTMLKLAGYTDKLID